MARIAGVNIPEDKKVKISLTYVFGIGNSLSQKILTKADVEKEKRVNQLSADELERIRKIVIKEYVCEGDLKSSIIKNIKRLKDTGTYRGVRHIKNLPVRGQRTKTNARTKRGKKITVSSGRKQAAQKT